MISKIRRNMLYFANSYNQTLPGPNNKTKVINVWSIARLSNQKENAKGINATNRRCCVRPSTSFYTNHRHVTYFSTVAVTYESRQKPSNWPIRGHTRSCYTGMTGVLLLSLAFSPYFSCGISANWMLVERLQNHEVPKTVLHLRHFGQCMLQSIKLNQGSKTGKGLPFDSFQECLL